jgi:hypothetical protein
VEQVEVVSAQNSVLENNQRSLELQVHDLSLELERRKRVDEENRELQAMNLKLQAKLLVSQKTPNNSKEELDVWREKYYILEGYYTELLEFVEASSEDIEDEAVL